MSSPNQSTIENESTSSQRQATLAAIPLLAAVRLVEYAKKVLQYPKGSKGYDPVDATNLQMAIDKIEKLILVNV